MGPGEEAALESNTGLAATTNTPVLGELLGQASAALGSRSRHPKGTPYCKKGYKTLPISTGADGAAPCHPWRTRRLPWASGLQVAGLA